MCQFQVGTNVKSEEKRGIDEGYGVVGKCGCGGKVSEGSASCCWEIRKRRLEFPVPPSLSPCSPAVSISHLTVLSSLVFFLGVSPQRAAHRGWA